MQFYQLVLRLLVDESMKPTYHLISQYYHFRTFAAWTRTAILHWVNPLLCEYLLYIGIHHTMIFMNITALWIIVGLFIVFCYRLFYKFDAYTEGASI